MRQTALIPKNNIVALARALPGAEENFREWLRENAAPILLTPNCDDMIKEEQMRASDLLHELKNKETLVMNYTTALVPNFDTNSELEPIVRILAKLESDRHNRSRNSVSTRWQLLMQEEIEALLVLVGLDQFSPYLEPHMREPMAMMNADLGKILVPGEKERHMAAQAIVMYKQSLEDSKLRED